MRAARIANRQLGTIEQIDGAGTLAIRLDSGRAVQVSSRAPRHLDHGYAVTSHSSQGATAERVLLHIDTGTAHAPLLNRRLAYVAVSRARAEAEIYTNDARTLGQALGREVTKRTALEVVKDHAPAAREPATRRDHEVRRQRTLAAAPLRPHRPAVSREQAWDRELRAPSWVLRRRVTTRQPCPSSSVLRSLAVVYHSTPVPSKSRSLDQTGASR